MYSRACISSVESFKDDFSINSACNPINLGASRFQNCTWTQDLEMEILGWLQKSPKLLSEHWLTKVVQYFYCNKFQHSE